MNKPILSYDESEIIDSQVEYIISDENEKGRSEEEILGGRDHTTVMYGHEKITGLLETDKNLRRKLINIQEVLYSPVGASV